ncbi:MAG: hypothetical protein ACLGGO_05695 [Coleofasciculus sp.]
MTLNPYQGLKLLLTTCTDNGGLVPMTLNPYQGLKLLLPGSEAKQPPRGSNDIESLSGIETGTAQRLNGWLWEFQ